MRLFFRIIVSAFLLWALFLPPSYAAERTSVGGACSGSASRADWDTIFQCSAGTWQRAPYLFGSTSDACTSANAGAVQWSGTALLVCDGTTWSSIGANASSAANTYNLFTSSGTWMPPSTVSSSNPLTVRVLIVGGGAGGTAMSTGSAGPGGGGSGHISAQSLQITSTAGIAITVGTGGASNTAGGASSFGALTANGGATVGNQTGGAGGSGGGAGGIDGSLTSAYGGAGGSNGGNGTSTEKGGSGGAGQGSPIVSSSTTVMGIIFQTASSFSAGTGGAGGIPKYPFTVGSYAWYMGSGGGGGGVFINGAGPSAGAGVSNSYAGSASGGTGWGAGGGGGAIGGSAGGTGASGVVYIEW